MTCEVSQLHSLYVCTCVHAMIPLQLRDRAIEQVQGGILGEGNGRTIVYYAWEVYNNCIPQERE